MCRLWLRDAQLLSHWFHFETVSLRAQVELCSLGNVRLCQLGQALPFVFAYLRRPCFCNKQLPGQLITPAQTSHALMLSFSGHLPLHRLKVVQEWTETTTAFKHHRAKAPVVHSNSVWLILKQFRCLQGRSGAFQQDTFNQQQCPFPPFLRFNLHLLFSYGTTEFISISTFHYL